MASSVTASVLLPIDVVARFGEAAPLRWRPPENTHHSESSYVDELNRRSTGTSLWTAPAADISSSACFGSGSAVASELARLPIA
eukprot:scaffold8931_cov65-Phaeocystis_antarctica.AAC.4